MDLSSNGNTGRGKISRDKVVKSLVREDFQDKDLLDLVSRLSKTPFLPVPVKLVVGTMVGYFTRLLVLFITVVVPDILRRIAPVPIDLGHLLPQQKDLFIVLPLEVHSQLVEVKAEVGAVSQVVRVL